MVGDNFRLNRENPNFHQILATQNSLNYTSSRIQTINNGLSDFKWVLISIFIGIAFSFLISFSNSWLYWVALFLFVIFILCIFHIYLVENRRRKEQVNLLRSEREEQIKQLYVFGLFNEETLEKYRKSKVISQSYYELLLNLPKDEIIKVRRGE